MSAQPLAFTCLQAPERAKAANTLNRSDADLDIVFTDHETTMGVDD
jgi:hypothetical protein